MSKKNSKEEEETQRVLTLDEFKKELSFNPAAFEETQHGHNATYLAYTTFGPDNCHVKSPDSFIFSWASSHDEVTLNNAMQRLIQKYPYIKHIGYNVVNQKKGPIITNKINQSYDVLMEILYDTIQNHLQLRELSSENVDDKKEVDTSLHKQINSYNLKQEEKRKQYALENEEAIKAKSSNMSNKFRDLFIEITKDWDLEGEEHNFHKRQNYAELNLDPSIKTGQEWKSLTFAQAVYLIQNDSKQVTSLIDKNEFECVFFRKEIDDKESSEKKYVLIKITQFTSPATIYLAPNGTPILNENGEFVYLSNRIGCEPVAIVQKDYSNDNMYYDRDDEPKVSLKNPEVFAPFLKSEPKSEAEPKLKEIHIETEFLSTANKNEVCVELDAENNSTSKQNAIVVTSEKTNTIRAFGVKEIKILFH